MLQEHGSPAAYRSMRYRLLDRLLDAPRSGD